MDDEGLYGKVAEELIRHGPNAGLWAMTFAECDGDQTKAKALYLRLRVAQLRNVENELERIKIQQHEIEIREQQNAQQEREREEFRQREVADQEAHKTLPFYRKKLSDEFSIFIIISFIGAIVVLVTLSHDRWK